ncbi:hypothetical protein [Variovorax sp. RCC_210]|uniref:hypothetical protein n=1 Tax=Variovorax sp. RCC_210 TaxID=3239217 RepID=UPI00352423BB
MGPDLLRYLESALDSFISTSINRVSETGVMDHEYRLTVQEIRSAGLRQRFGDTFIDEIVSFFEGNRVGATYNPRSESFSVALGLGHVVLNASQAGALTSAMNHYRMES